MREVHPFFNTKFIPPRLREREREREMTSLQSQILSSLGTGGCLISKLQEDLNKNTREGFHLSNVISNYQDACRTDRFLHHFLHSGLGRPSFKPNPNLGTTHHEYTPCIHKFEQGLSEASNLTPSARLGLVFHGTPKRENIKSILLHGLDPRKRYRQSYGPGEYFSTDPELSLKYSNGLQEIIVCLVIFPESITSTPIQTTAPQQRRPKPSIIVVQNDKHHLPLGTLSFGSDPSNDQERVQNAVMQRSIREKSLSRKLVLEQNKTLIVERNIARQQELEQNKNLAWEREIARIRELELKKKLFWEREIARIRVREQKKKLFWEREIARIREMEQKKKLLWEREIARVKEDQKKMLIRELP